MQAGFAMLEAGIVQPKNATNILFKNLIDASLAAISFWLIGYGVAYGTDSGGFIGTDQFFVGNGASSTDINNDVHGYQSWFFQWAFAGAAATIVAGSVCERAKIEAYFVYSIVLTVFIYPVCLYSIIVLHLPLVLCFDSIVSSTPTFRSVLFDCVILVQPSNTHLAQFARLIKIFLARPIMIFNWRLTCSCVAGGSALGMGHRVPLCLGCLPRRGRQRSSHLLQVRKVQRHD